MPRKKSISIKQSTSSDHEIVVKELKSHDSGSSNSAAAPIIKQIKQAPIPTIEKKHTTEIKQKNSVSDHFWLKTIPFFLCIVVLGGVAATNYFLFSTNGLHSFAQPVARFFHFPVIITGQHIITYPSVEKEQKKISAYYSNQQQPATQSDVRTVEMAMTKLIKDSILQEGYKQYQISVTSAELEKSFVNLFGDTKTSSVANMLTQSTVGMSPDEFMSTLLTDYMLRSKLSKAIAASAEGVQKTRLTAEKVHTEAKQSQQNFEQLLLKYSSALPNRGDLGFFAFNDLPSEYAALGSMPKGSISEVIETSSGFHIVRVKATLPADTAKDKIAYIQLDEIFLEKPNLEQWMYERLDRSATAVMSFYYSWSTHCQQVTFGKRACSKASSESAIDATALHNIVFGSNNTIPLAPR